MAGHANTQEALRIVQELFQWVLQKRNPDTDEWESLGRPIKGRTAALEVLNKRKALDKSGEYRALPKNEADKYREGLNAGKKGNGSRSRRPLLALPENL
jgi:hypothetical protein